MISIRQLILLNLNHIFFICSNFWRYTVFIIRILGHKNTLSHTKSFLIVDTKQLLTLFIRLDFRHEKYYVFITNGTVSPEELNALNPVYHDEHVKPSYQNTIVFPGGHHGLQVYILVNRTGIDNADHGNYVELCEAEVYGSQFNYRYFWNQSSYLIHLCNEDMQNHQSIWTS